MQEEELAAAGKGEKLEKSQGRREAEAGKRKTQRRSIGRCVSLGGGKRRKNRRRKRKIRKSCVGTRMRRRRREEEEEEVVVDEADGGEERG